MKTWEDVPGWFDFDDIYDEAIAAAPPAGSFHVSRFVEVGSAFGRSAIYMAQAIRASRKLIDFHAIDLWAPGHVPGGDHLRRVAESLGGMRQAFAYFARECGVSDLIRVTQADQVEAAKLYPGGCVDLVFLDTCHTEKGTRAAIQAWLPKVRPGGIFAGHDFTADWPGVIAAVRDLLPGAESRRSSFFWRVPA